MLLTHSYCFFFFFFNDTATTEIYTLSLHDALPISNYRRTCCISWTPSRHRIWCSPEPSISAECSRHSERRLTRSEEHTSELQSRLHLVCRLLLEKKKKKKKENNK